MALFPHVIASLANRAFTRLAHSHVTVARSIVMAHSRISSRLTHFFGSLRSWASLRSTQKACPTLVTAAAAAARVRLRPRTMVHVAECEVLTMERQQLLPRQRQQRSFMNADDGKAATVISGATVTTTQQLSQRYNNCHNDTTTVTTIQQLSQRYNNCHNDTTNVTTIQQMSQRYNNCDCDCHNDTTTAIANATTLLPHGCST
jgi:hypothetical protein